MTRIEAPKTPRLRRRGEKNIEELSPRSRLEDLGSVVTAQRVGGAAAAGNEFWCVVSFRNASGASQFDILKAF